MGRKHNRKVVSKKPVKVKKVKIAKPKRVKAPKTRNNFTWSESEYFSRVRSALRRVFRYWIPMQLALKAASRPSQSDNKRLKTEYLCAKCGKWRKRADVQIDHIEECGSLNSYNDIVPFFSVVTVWNFDLADFKEPKRSILVTSNATSIASTNPKDS